MLTNLGHDNVVLTGALARKRLPRMDSTRTPTKLLDVLARGLGVPTKSLEPELAEKLTELANLTLIEACVGANADLSHFGRMRRCFGEPAGRFQKRRRYCGLSRDG